MIPVVVWVILSLSLGWAAWFWFRSHQTSVKKEERRHWIQKRRAYFSILVFCVSMILLALHRSRQIYERQESGDWVGLVIILVVFIAFEVGGNLLATRRLSNDGPSRIIRNEKSD